MSREERITCDQCGSVKKETNHWYSADVSAAGVFWLGQFGKRGAGAQDICGHQCAIAALNQFLQTGKLEKPKSIEEKA